MTDNRFCDRCGAPRETGSLRCPFCKTPYLGTERVTIYSDNGIYTEMPKPIPLVDKDVVKSSRMMDWQKATGVTFEEASKACQEFAKCMPSMVIEIPECKHDRKKKWLERTLNK